VRPFAQSIPMSIQYMTSRDPFSPFSGLPVVLSDGGFQPLAAGGATAKIPHSPLTKQNFCAIIQPQNTPNFLCWSCTFLRSGNNGKKICRISLLHCRRLRQQAGRRQEKIIRQLPQLRQKQSGTYTQTKILYYQTVTLLSPVLQGFRPI
jgi:hypothetical protein